jgi:MFS family permease
MARFPRPLPIYLATGAIFSALAARGFLLPLRVHEIGGDKVQVGLLFTVFTVTAAALALPAGFLADRFGRRSLVLFAVVMSGVSHLGLAAPGSVLPLFAWQALGGLGAGAAQAALFAALADVVPGSRVGRAMGWLTFSMQAGFLVGPAVCGLALRWLSLQGTLALSAGFLGAALLLSLLIPSAARIEISWNLTGPLRQIAGRPGFAPAVLGLFGATLLWGTLQAFIPLFGKEQLRLPETQIGYVLAIQAVANGLARIPGGQLVDRSQRLGSIVILCLAGFAACLALLPHLDGFWTTTAVLVAGVPLVATAYIALSVVFTGLSTKETRGVAMGLYGTVMFLGLGFGPAVFGPVMERGGYVAGFTACAATGLLLAGLVALLGRAPALMRRPASAVPPAAPGA